MVLCCRRYPFYSTALLYTYISRFSVNPQHQQKRIIRQSCHHKFYPQPLFNFSYNRPTFAFTSESGHTLGSLRKIAHKGSHAETGVFRTGVVSLPSERSTRFGNPAWPGFKTAYFAAFGSWSDVLLKNAESLGTAMRSCVSLFRGVAAPLGCVIFFYFCQNCDFYALRTQSLSVCARRGWYHYPRCALCAVETLGARLSK